MTKDEILDGVNFTTADDKRRLLGWLECPKRHPDSLYGRPLFIVGPKGSGKTTLAVRLMEYFGEKSVRLAPQGDTLRYRTMRREGEFLRAAESSKIVVIDGLPIVKSRDVDWMYNVMTGMVYKRRKPRSTFEIESYDIAAHMVATALAMAKCVEKRLLSPENEKYVATVRLEQRHRLAGGGVSSVEESRGAENGGEV